MKSFKQLIFIFVFVAHCYSFKSILYQKPKPNDSEDKEYIQREKQREYQHELNRNFTHFQVRFFI